MTEQIRIKLESLLGWATLAENGYYKVEWDDGYKDSEATRWTLEEGYHNSIERVESELNTDEVNTIVLTYILSTLGVALGFGFANEGEEFYATPEEILNATLDVINAYRGCC